MKKLLPSFLLLFSSPVFAQADHFLLVGTYASPKSEGIHVYRFNSKDGSATALGPTRTSNPSYLAISPNQRFVYAVNEDEAGGVSAYSFDKKTGQLTLINQRSSGGAHPCYIAVDKTGQWVVAGNYSSGTIALFKVQKNGGLDSAVQVIEHEGYSVNTDRQQGPHVHATVFSPDNKYLYVPDLGIDKVMIYAFDAKKGNLHPAPAPFEISEAGAGPRHFEFHPSGKWAYLMEELSGAVAVYAYKNGQLNLMQNIT
ncbi:MAG TPA: lactonase family protein, partial [Chitinophagaceae bacterium]|nr:lactonase family protein [Chitinophagaceae bacterium]